MSALQRLPCGLNVAEGICGVCSRGDLHIPTQGKLSDLGSLGAGHAPGFLFLKTL